MYAGSLPGVRGFAMSSSLVHAHTGWSKSARVLASKLKVAFHEQDFSLNFQPNRTPFKIDTLLVWSDPEEIGMCWGGCASYLREERKFKISARSDKPFRRSSADRQTDKQTDRHPKFSGITGVRGFANRSANKTWRTSTLLIFRLFFP